VALADLSWVDAEPVLTSSSVVVIPLGAALLEQGPHLKLNSDDSEKAWLAWRPGRGIIGPPGSLVLARSQDHRPSAGRHEHGLPARRFGLMMLLRWQLAYPMPPIALIGRFFGAGNVANGIMLPEFYNQLGAMA
jgi:hypothetical protein